MTPTRPRSRGWLAWIERTGNALPDPVSLFLILIGLVVGLSALLASLGVEAKHPGTGEMIRAQNLLSAELIRRLLTEMPRTFAGFPPLGLVLVVMLGIGIADKTGLIAAALRGVLRRVPAKLLSAAVVFVGIMSSLAVDAGYVVVIPLGAFVFWAAGRHPLAGLAAAFAGVSGAFSANLFLTSLDPLLAGFTQSAAQLIDPRYTVRETANYYFIVALTPLLTLVGMAVTEWIVEPRLGPYRGQAEVAELSAALSPEERRGLRWAGLALLLVLALVGLLVLPPGAPLRGEDGSLAPFYGSIVAIMFFCFLIPGLAYGIATGRIRSDRDAVRMSAEAMSDMALYIVLAFAAAHFIAVFNWSNLGAILAIKGAELLKGLGLGQVPLLVGLILVTAFVNLFIGSASAKWALLAPIFVPMFMLLGFSPELVQMAYRVGDSATNIITPLLPYFPLILTFALRYERSAGIGTLIALMLPYSIAFLLAMTATLALWVFLGIPPGPDIPLRYEISR
ncbi:MAG: AbgT family transporter [Bacteroidota bacterium]|nr:AbgT family transporter [Bacteroidota bacterium]